MNRAVFASLTILLLLSISSITGLIQAVKADGGTIYIRAEGSISPSTAPVYSADNTTYTLTGNITANADGIVVGRDNIVLDGAGFTVAGNGTASGVILGDLENVTVGNMTITNFLDGIVLYTSFGNILSGNNVANNQWGIVLSSNVFYWGGSSNNTLSGNNVENNGYGIYLDSSSNNKRARA
jgi:parallel beta-helix repeat protein